MRRRCADDWGVIGLVPAIIAVLVGVAAGAVTLIAVRSNDGGKPVEADVAVVVGKVVGTRDARGRPHIQIPYTVAVGDARAEVFTVESRVTCSVFEDAGRHRVVIAETRIFAAAGRSREGTLVVTPAETDSDLTGPVRVQCDAERGSKRFHAPAVQVVIPGTDAPIDEAQQYAGKYDVVFTRTRGIESNCDQVKRRTVRIAAVSGSQISIEVAGAGNEGIGISAVTVSISRTAQFSGEIFLDPGEPEWRGLLAGRFSKESGTSTVRGTFTRDDGRCTYDFVGSLATAPTPGALVISLEDIPGVDGCQAELSETSIKAGSITFRVTNNTFGFAQIFIYDSERNLAAHNKDNIPERGGTKSFVATLAPGTHYVQCDGPGGEDKTVELTVS
jgi:hypothetical protein